jgi:hypothetical protein
MLLGIAVLTIVPSSATRNMDSIRPATIGRVLVVTGDGPTRVGLTAMCRS